MASVGYTPDELDKIESLMDKLPHVQGMFWAGDTGWEHIISELHAIATECAKRRGDESQRKLDEAGGDMQLLSALEALRSLRVHWALAEDEHGVDESARYNLITDIDKPRRVTITYMGEAGAEFTTNDGEVWQKIELPADDREWIKIEGLAFDVTSDPIREIQCSFCSQLSLKRVTPDVNWCQKCGTVTIGEGIERYCQAPELAMETQASINEKKALLAERKAQDDIVHYLGKVRYD